MTDKKLTDQEIIKALKYCKEQGLTSECFDCAYKGVPEDCMSVLLGEVIDLINRLQADVKHLDDESDALRADIYFLEEELKTAEAENERLRESCSHIDICCKNCKYLIRYKGGAPLVAQCTKRHKDFLPFDVGDSIETYYCRGFAPFKFNTTNEVEIKSKAYKEFAERLKGESRLRSGVIPWYEIHEIVDNLLKELVGDKNV